MSNIAINFCTIRLSIIILCRFSLDLRLKNAAFHSSSSPHQQTTSDTGSGTRTHLSWSPMPTNSTTAYDESSSSSLELGNTSVRRSKTDSLTPIQRAVQYIHEELVSEFGESTSSLTMVDPNRPSNVGSDDFENSTERSPILNINFGEFRWPGNRGNQLFAFTPIGTLCSCASAV